MIVKSFSFLFAWHLILMFFQTSNSTKNILIIQEAQWMLRLKQIWVWKPKIFF